MEYILFIIIIAASPIANAGITSIETTFSSEQTCSDAGKRTIHQLTNTGRGYATVLSWGCYKK